MADVATLFEPVVQDGVSDRIVQQFEDMIVRGILAEGSRLPSERELSERLQVSRPKLRDALKDLESRGLVVVRHGEGTFIAELSGQAMKPALIDLFAKRGTAFFDYLEYRRHQEAFAARLAAERATASDRAEILRVLDLLQAAHDADDRRASMEHDVGFHMALVNASHNVMLIHMMTSIYELTRRGVFYNRDYLRTLDGTGEALMAQHRDIADAVLAGDADRAEAAAQAHLSFVERSFRIGKEQEERERQAKRRQLAAELADKSRRS